jgi:hypothetical protein
LPADLQQFAQVLDAEVGDGVIVGAVNVDDAVLGLHLDADLVEQILVLTKHLSDAGEGEDVGDGCHAQAA